MCLFKVLSSKCFARIAKVSFDVLEKSADKNYLDVSSDTEVIDTTSKNNTIDSSNELVILGKKVLNGKK